MEKYQLTIEAEFEIAEIYEYSILKFGLTIAREYVFGLHEKFDLLAVNQSWGSDYAFIKTGLCRFEYRSHSIYCQIHEKRILIVRILGNRQDPAQQFENIKQDSK